MELAKRTLKENPLIGPPVLFKRTLHLPWRINFTYILQNTRSKDRILGKKTYNFLKNIVRVKLIFFNN